jgi:hypothetical protein
MFSKVTFSLIVLKSTLLIFRILTSSGTDYALADLNFPAAGDRGWNSNTQKTVNNINSKAP